MALSLLWQGYSAGEKWAFSLACGHSHLHHTFNLSPPTRKNGLLWMPSTSYLIYVVFKLHLDADDYNSLASLII